MILMDILSADYYLIQIVSSIWNFPGLVQALQLRVTG
jgi:hypothetical protein